MDIEVSSNSNANIVTAPNYKQAKILAVWLLIGGLISAAAWLHLNIPAQLVVLWFLVLAWMLTPSRLTAWLLMTAYYLILSRDAATAIERFTSIGLPLAWAINMLYCAAIAALWASVWQPSPTKRIVGLVIALVATTLPPLGGYIPGSPLLAAGWLYPATGFWGLLLVTVSWAAAYQYLCNPSFRVISASVVITCILVSAHANLHLQIRESYGIHVLNTQLGRFPKELVDQYAMQLELTKAAMEALKQPLPIVAMPEEVAGTWQPRYAWLWEEVNQAYLSANKTLVVGFDTKPDQYANTAKIFGQKPPSQPDIYARVPAPIGGWNPWSAVHMPARWMGNNTVKLQQQQLALFFCWEELVPWPWLATGYAQHGDSVQAVVMVNHWFAKDLDIGDSQARSSEAWSKLFGWTRNRIVNSPEAAIVNKLTSQDVKTTPVKP